MDANYRLDLFTPARVLKNSIGWETRGDDPSKTGFQSLTCELKVNEPDKLVVLFPANHNLIADLEDRSMVELWEEDSVAGIASHRFFSGIYRSPRYKDHGERGVFTLIAEGDLSLLDWRIVNYYADYTNRSAFTSVKAETIMKNLVLYNITLAATTGNGRKRNGDNWPGDGSILNGSDLTLGNTLDWYCHGDRLLKTLQELADVGGGDFSLDKILTPSMWRFNFHLGQLGTDKTASVIFSADRDNLDDLSYDLRRSKEYTVACVWGNYKGADREYLTRTGTNYSATNDREMYVNATGVQTTAGQNARGDAKLAKVEAKEDFRFTARVDHLYVFNKDVFLGDLVTVVNVYTGASLTGKIIGANLVLKPTHRQLTLEVETN